MCCITPPPGAMDMNSTLATNDRDDGPGKYLMSFLYIYIYFV